MCARARPFSRQTLQRPEQFLGLRFFYPCVLIPPAEISVGPATSQQTVDRLVAFLLLIQKTPHRGPTKRVLSKQEANAFQFDTAVLGGFYHGLLEPKRVEGVANIVTGLSGPALVRPSQYANTTSL